VNGFNQQRLSHRPIPGPRLRVSFRTNSGGKGITGRGGDKEIFGRVLVGVVSKPALRRPVDGAARTPPVRPPNYSPDVLFSL